MKLAKNMLVGLAVTAMLTACSQNRSEAELIRSAKAALAKSDLNTARIELQNVLQSNPASAEARVVMGQVLMKSGRPAEAEIEFRKATDAGFPRDVIAPEIARSLLAQQQNKAVVDQFRTVQLSDLQADAELKASVVMALMRLGQLDQARDLADGVLAKVPANTSMQLAKTRQAAAAGDVNGALTVLSALLAKQPGNADAQQLHGDLLAYGKNDTKAAAAAYAKALAIEPANVVAHSSLIGIRIADKDIAGARAQLKAMSTALPGSYHAKYAEAQIEYADGKFAKARDLLQPLLKLAPKDPRLLQFAGTVEMQLHAPVQAEAHLSKAVSLAPDVPLSRRLLAQTHLRLGNDGKALDILRPLIGADSTDVDALIIAADASMTAGEFRRAEELFARAAKLRPQDEKVRTSLALTLVSKGQADAGIAELRRISTAHRGVVADLALVAELLRAGNLDGALAAIDVLAEKEPRNPRPAQMKARVLIMKRDVSGARKNLEAALALDPSYFPAIASLAAMDAAAGKYDEATRRLQAVVSADSRHTQALIALADLGIRTRKPADETAQWLEKAIAGSPVDVVPRQMLVDLWLSAGDRKKALQAAQAGHGALPDHPAMLDALGRAEMASGNINQAIATFGKLANIQPRNAAPHLRLAEAYRVARNDAAAEQSLRRALAVAPRNLDAHRGLVVLALKNKRPQDALQVTRALQKSQPDDTAGYLLESDVHLHSKNVDEAVKVLRRGLDRSQGQLLAIHLHQTLLDHKRMAEADQLSNDWRKRHPANALFTFHLGNVALKAGDLPKAERLYGEVVQVEPTNAKALNNLAWIKVQTKQAGAVSLAEKAVALAPRSPALLDTLALALEHEGQRARAIETYVGALKLAPADAGLKLALASMYLRAGEKDKARPLVDELAKLGDKFGRQADVDALRRQL